MKSATSSPTKRDRPVTPPARTAAAEETLRLANREARPTPTIVECRNAGIGGGASFAVIAGPCAVENSDQIMRAAEIVADCGVSFFRAGAFKPRTSPYSFQGLGVEGLRLLGDVRRSFDLRIVTEAMDDVTLPFVADVADIVQIGSRNMHNYKLLQAAGKIEKPILLKRGMSATIEEWLLAAEYVLASGNPNVILCERGIRTFETLTRNTLDLAGAVVAKSMTHLPIIADPSHGVGVAAAIPAVAVAASASGLDGVMIEMHPQPSEALSDGFQALNPAQMRETIRRIRDVWRAANQGCEDVVAKTNRRA